jgi:hypothetical protein
MITKPTQDSTPPQDSTIPETAFCGDLRSKSFFMLDGLPAQESDFLDPSGNCWCYHTQQAIGPDGALAGPQACVPGRGCYRSALAEPT